jgi:hypothetical protein
MGNTAGKISNIGVGFIEGLRMANQQKWDLEDRKWQRKREEREDAERQQLIEENKAKAQREREDYETRKNAMTQILGLLQNVSGSQSALMQAPVMQQSLESTPIPFMPLFGQMLEPALQQKATTAQEEMESPYMGLMFNLAGAGDYWESLQEQRNAAERNKVAQQEFLWKMTNEQTDNWRLNAQQGIIDPDAPAEYQEAAKLIQEANKAGTAGNLAEAQKKNIDANVALQTAEAKVKKAFLENMETEANIALKKAQTGAAQRNNLGGGGGGNAGKEKKKTEGEKADWAMAKALKSGGPTLANELAKLPKAKWFPIIVSYTAGKNYEVILRRIIGAQAGLSKSQKEARIKELLGRAKPKKGSVDALDAWKQSRNLSQ